MNLELIFNGLETSHYHVTVSLGKGFFSLIELEIVSTIIELQGENDHLKIH